MTTPTYSDLLAAHHAAETERIRLAAELKTTQTDLWRLRTLRRLPHLEPAIDLVSGATEDEFAARADELVAALAAAWAARTD